MFDDSSIIVGLEIGTSKVCAVVGERSADGALNLIGLGQARSRGVRKGEIADPTQAEEDVRNAIVEAEQMADVEIRNVYLGVTGGHIRGFNNRGVHPVVSADREISDDDVQDVIKNAKAINLPTENNVVHAIRQHFFEHWLSLRHWSQGEYRWGVTFGAHDRPDQGLLTQIETCHLADVLSRHLLDIPDIRLTEIGIIRAEHIEP